MMRLLSGTFAVVSLMTGSVVEQLVPTTLEMNSSSSEAAELEAQRIGVASAVALLSGIIMVKHWTKRLNPKIQCISCECSFEKQISPVRSSACVVSSWAFSPPISRSQS